MVKTRLKEIRLERGKKQLELAQLLNIQQNTYSQYETGKRQISLDFLIKLAKFYNVTTDYILMISDVDMPY